MRQFGQTKKGKGATKSSKKKKKKVETDEEDTPTPTTATCTTPKESTKPLTALEKAQLGSAARGTKSKGRGRGRGMKPKSPKKAKTPAKKPPKKKMATSWGISNHVSNKQINANSTILNSTVSVQDAKKKYLASSDEEPMEGWYDSDAEYSESESDEEEKSDAKPGFFSRLKNSVSTLTGNKKLTAEDLQPILSHFKDNLMSKNVAEGISEKLCNAIKANLLDTKSQRFTTLKTTVRESL